MRKDLKIGLLVGMILVIGIVMMVSLWPGQGVEERQQKTFQADEVHLQVGINKPADETEPDIPKVIEETPVAAPVKKPVRVHTVSKGETLSSIAIEYYGSTGYIQKIVDANPKLSRDPDKIRSGTQLIIPNLD